MIGSVPGLEITGSGDSITVAAAAAVANEGSAAGVTGRPVLPTGRTLRLNEGSDAFNCNDTWRGPPTSRVLASPLGRAAPLPLPRPLPFPFAKRGPLAGRGAL